MSKGAAKHEDWPSSFRRQMLAGIRLCKEQTGRRPAELRISRLMLPHLLDKPRVDKPGPLEFCGVPIVLIDDVELLDHAGDTRFRMVAPGAKEGEDG